MKFVPRRFASTWRANEYTNGHRPLTFLLQTELVQKYSCGVSVSHNREMSLDASRVEINANPGESEAGITRRMHGI